MTSRIEQRALITGASSGIGKATALAFAKAGIDVALVSRSQDKLEAVATAAREAGIQAKAYALDLVKVEQVEAGIRAIAQDFGGVDILVNSAGIGYTNLLSDTPLAEWQHAIALNLTSVLWPYYRLYVSSNGERLSMLPRSLASNLFPLGELITSVKPVLLLYRRHWQQKNVLMEFALLPFVLGQ